MSYCQQCADLQREIADLRQKFKLAVEFALSPERMDTVTIRKVFGHRMPKSPMWKVMRDSFAFTKDGDWEWEPVPSERDDEFYARCRFDTFEEAMAAARNASCD